MNLRQRILHAGTWTLGAYGIELATRLLTNLILTRLLFPEAFGLVAASSSLVVGLALVSDLGIRSMIVQSAQGEEDDFLRTAWVFQISRGIALWLILILICTVVSLPVVRETLPSGSVFASPTFPLLTIALGFPLVLHGFESTAIALNIRRLNYRPLVIVDLAGKIIPVPVMIGYAIVSPSVWALVAGVLAAGVARTVLSHFVVPGPKMALTWKKTYVQEMAHFGKWITVSSIGSFVASQSDVILFGLLLPSSFLGIYVLAKTLTDTAEGLLDRLNSALTLPVLSEVLRNNPDNLRDRYYRFRLPIDLVAAACGGFLFVTANQIIGILYDARYAEAGPLLRLLALGLAIYPPQIIRSAFLAVGNTRIVAMVSIVQAGSLVAFLLVGFFTAGPLGAVLGVVASRLLPSALILLAAHGRKWISIQHELRVVLVFSIGLSLGEAALAIGKSFAPVALQQVFG
jgi:O-antigen/teichoic acid export membrane protein